MCCGIAAWSAPRSGSAGRDGGGLAASLPGDLLGAAMTTMTRDQRAYTLRCARILAETGEDAESVDALIAKAAGYRPVHGRERLNLTVRGRRIAPED